MARNPHASYEASDHQRMPIIPIANNLTTTVSGYALDARQGKALNDKMPKRVFINITSSDATFATQAYGGYVTGQINLTTKISGLIEILAVTPGGSSGLSAYPYMPILVTATSVVLWSPTNTFSIIGLQVLYR